MKLSDLRHRPMVSVTIRMPEELITDLKRIAQIMGFDGYQPLIRHYVSQGLRADLDRLDHTTVQELVDSLKRHGIDESVITRAMSEIRLLH